MIQGRLRSANDTDMFSRELDSEETEQLFGDGETGEQVTRVLEESFINGNRELNVTESEDDLSSEGETLKQRVPERFLERHLALAGAALSSGAVRIRPESSGLGTSGSGAVGGGYGAWRILGDGGGARGSRN